MSTGPRLRRIAPAILVGVLAFLVTLDVRVQQKVEASSAERRTELARIVASRQMRTQALEAAVADLRARLEREAAGSSSEDLRALSQQLDSLARLAGAAPVVGPAVIVTLSDAPGAELGDADFRIQDLDLQVAVNELWAAGAEAIAVNGQRLIATSAIRNAGDAVLVNYRVLTSPYRITAAGNAPRIRERFASSPTAARFERWRDIYGLGFIIATAESQTLPSFDGSNRLRYAEPIRAG